MLDSPETTQRFLIGSGVEEPDVLGFFGKFGQEDGVGVRFPAVIVFAVTGQSSQENPMVFVIPMVDRQQNVTLIDPPSVGQGRHERTVDHVPAFAVVLLLLVDDREESCTAFADGERSEFREDVRFVDSGLVTEVFNLRDDLFGHVFIVVIEGQGVLDRESSSDVQRIEFRADFLQFAIHGQALVQFVPIVGSVLDPGVDEEVQHFQLDLRIGLDPGAIELFDVVVANSQTGSIEVEFGFFFGGDSDSYFARFGNGAVQQFQFGFIVQNGNRVFKPVVDESGNVFDVLRTFESVADDVGIFIDGAVFIQGVDDMDVVGGRGFEVDVIFERFFQNERKMRAFGTVAIVVAAFIIHFGHGYIEESLGPLNLR